LNYKAHKSAGRLFYQLLHLWKQLHATKIVWSTEVLIKRISVLATFTDTASFLEKLRIWLLVVSQAWNNALFSKKSKLHSARKLAIPKQQQWCTTRNPAQARRGLRRS